MAPNRMEEELALTNGLRDYPDAKLLQKGQVQKSRNYERDGIGRMVKRTEPETYNSDLQSQLDSTFDSITTMSPPYYPGDKPDDMTNEFMLLFYGVIGGSYALRLAYEQSGNWTLQTLSGLSSDNITYTADSDLEFTVGENRIIITDGVNNAHYVTVDAEGTIVSGVLGIPAPLNKATVEELTALTDEPFEFNADAEYLDEPGLFQCVYTVETETGEESNPSPVSDTHVLQYFETDEDGVTQRWIDQITIKNLSIPEVNTDIQDRLAYFRVYFRILPYSEGDAPASLTFSQRFKILDKNNTAGTTGNTYTLKLPVDPGNVVAYNNNVAPIAKHAAQVSGFTALGNLQTQAEFPYEYDYYVPITLNNLNTKTYVDAVIQVRIYDEGSGHADAITNLDWSDFDGDGDDVIDAAELHHLRIYDEDLVTPLRVAYQMDTSAGYCDVYIRVSQLPATLARTIYLCFAPDTAGYGVTESEHQTFTYGQWFSLDDDLWANQPVWTPMKVWSFDSIVAAPCDLEDSTDYVYNRANLETNGQFTDVSWSANPVAEIYDLAGAKPVGSKALELTGTTSQLPFEYEPGHSNELLPLFPEQGYVSLWIQYNADDLPALGGTGSARNVLNLIADEDNYLALQIYKDPGDSTQKWLITLESGGTIHRFTGPSVGQVSGSEYTYHLIFSWDNDGHLCLFEDATRTTWTPDADLMEDWTDVDLYIGGEGKYDALPMVVDDIQLVQHHYFTDQNRAWNIRNFQPGFETPLGYKYVGTAVNENISFGDTETASLETRENAYRWSKPGGLSFPANWDREVREPILRMIDLPSFLQFQYQNTIGIFTRNTFARKVLTGQPEDWVDASDVLIQEMNQYGLLVPDSLQKIGESLLWQSEVGLIYWTPQGRRKISHEQVEIDMEPAGQKDLDSFTSLYVPAKDQYWLHQQYRILEEVEVALAFAANAEFATVGTLYEFGDRLQPVIQLKVSSMSGDRDTLWYDYGKSPDSIRKANPDDGSTLQERTFGSGMVDHSGGKTFAGAKRRGEFFDSTLYVLNPGDLSTMTSLSASNEDRPFGGGTKIDVYESAGTIYMMGKTGGQDLKVIDTGDWSTAFVIPDIQTDTWTVYDLGGGNGVFYLSRWNTDTSEAFIQKMGMDGGLIASKNVEDIDGWRSAFSSAAAFGGGVYTYYDEDLGREVTTTPVTYLGGSYSGFDTDFFKLGG